MVRNKKVRSTLYLSLLFFVFISCKQRHYGIYKAFPSADREQILDSIFTADPSLSSALKTDAPTSSDNDLLSPLKQSDIHNQGKAISVNKASSLDSIILAASVNSVANIARDSLDISDKIAEQIHAESKLIKDKKVEELEKNVPKTKNQKVNPDTVFKQNKTVVESTSFWPDSGKTVINKPKNLKPAPSIVRIGKTDSVPVNQPSAPANINSSIFVFPKSTIREYDHRDSLIITSNQLLVKVQENRLKDSITLAGISLKVDSLLRIKTRELKKLKEDTISVIQPAISRDTVYKDVIIHLHDSLVKQSDTLYFDLSKSIPNNFESVQKRSFNYLKKNPTCYVLLSSHTDSRGSAALNDRLSYSRAAMIKQKLIASGLAEKQIFIQSFGEKYARPQAYDKDRKVVLNILCD